MQHLKPGTRVRMFDAAKIMSIYANETYAKRMGGYILTLKDRTNRGLQDILGETYYTYPDLGSIVGDKLFDVIYDSAEEIILEVLCGI